MELKNGIMEFDNGHKAWNDQEGFIVEDRNGNRTECYTLYEVEKIVNEDKYKNYFDKEFIYDDEIHPLMEKILDICQDNNIQMVASFYIGHNDDGELKCTSYLESSTHNDNLLLDARNIIFNE